MMSRSERTNTTTTGLSTENTEDNTAGIEEKSTLDITTAKHTDITLSDITKDSNIRTNALSSSSSNPLESTGVSNNSLTDITNFLSSTTFTDTDIDKSRNITKDLILRKQFLHDIQKLKIELSQKNLLVDSLKADHLNVVDDLEDKLSDVIHEKQLLQAKFETQIRMVTADTAKEIKRLKGEVQRSFEVQKCSAKRLEEIRGKNIELRAGFAVMELNEEMYLELKQKNIENLSNSEYFAVKLHENMRPLRVQVESLEQRITMVTSDLRDKEDELINTNKLYADESDKRNELNVRCQRFQVQMEDLKSQLSRDTYRNQNYDHVEGERDAFERQIADLERTCTVYKTELEGKGNEMETVRSQLLEHTQNVALLRQDKEYLSRQLNELTPRHCMMEEKYDHTVKQLDETKKAREELYEKYLNSREHYKSEYEMRMKQELDQLTNKTNTELERIKENTKEMYEQENRNLRESKNQAISEQDRLSSSEKDVQLRYNQILGEFRQLQVSSDSRLSECQNQTKLKSFELDRIQLLYEDSLKTNKELRIQADVYAKKLETLNKEYYSISGSSGKRICELESKNEELRSKLTIYEKLEQELDDVVMQAAEVHDEGDAERVLFAYGYGANVPSTAKRRMQQSVQLARRVLQLERANTSLRQDIERETKKREQLANELNQATSLLNEAQQPYNYLIGSIQTRDEQNEMMKKTVATLEEDLRQVKEDNVNLRRSNDQMTSDLERLLNQREEMGLLKQVVVNMKSTNATESQQKVNRTSTTTVHGEHVKHRTLQHNKDVNTVKAKPVLFTKSDPPSWYERLKRQNEMKSYTK